MADSVPPQCNSYDWWYKEASGREWEKLKMCLKWMGYMWYNTHTHTQSFK